jgi:hypothetical protein
VKYLVMPLVALLLVPFGAAKIADRLPYSVRSSRATPLPGDVDLTGEVDQIDMLRLLNYLFRDIPIKAPDCVADVNADSSVTIVDLVLMVSWIYRPAADLRNGCEMDSTMFQDFWPWKVGNYWVYQRAQSASWPATGPLWRSEVVAAGGDTAVIVESSLASAWTDTTVLRRRGHVVDWRRSPTTWAWNYRFNAGSAWTHQDRELCNDGARWVAQLEEDSIVTPAGTFDGCLRIQPGPYSNVCSDAGTLRQWWAPGVGLVRRIEDNVFGAQVFELAEFGIQ